MPKAAGANVGLLRRSADKMAQQGRGGDRHVAHVTKGEMVLTKSFMEHEDNRDLMVGVLEAMRKQGIDPRTRIVGTPQGPVNPKTGAEEFKDGDQGDGPSSDIGGAGGSTESGYSDSGGGYTSPGQADQDLANDQAGGKFGGPPGRGGSYTGIDFVDRMIDKVVQNPVTTMIDFAFGMTPLGLPNTISGLLGGPTVGKGVTAMARELTQDTPATPTGPAFAESPGQARAGEPPPDMGGAGGPHYVEADDVPREMVPTPNAYVPTGLLTPATNRLSNKARPTPATRFYNRA